MSNPVLIAIITSATSTLNIIATIVISFKSNRNARKIEQLKNDLEIKKITDNQIFTYLMTYETENINQSIVLLKEFLSLIQLTKDSIRDIVEHYDAYFEEERLEKIKLLRLSVVQQFSKSIYYFFDIDENKDAHKIKHLVVSICNALEFDYQKTAIINELEEISHLQSRLQIEVDKKINERLNSFRR